MTALSRSLDVGGIRDLAERFDYFILDQFGVLHDGTAPYPGAVDAVERLKAEGVTTLVLSNSGKRVGPNEARLTALGFAPGIWTHFLTSGEVAWGMLNEMLADPSDLRCLLISRDGDRSAVDGLPLRLTHDAATADIVLISGSESELHDLAHYRKLLEPAARRNVPAICTNPDKIMLTASGPCFGAGRIADLYRELGGSVRMIGKPFAEIYDAAHRLLGMPDRSRIVCVGDSVEHDIAGGKAAGFSTALVETGILETMTQTEKSGLFAQHDATPDYLLARFAW
ncbi:MAG: TIGR01459 family HAD-type hydrolase [Oricola sp.]|nr:TIGR01459 family HAD-type hydrolase [Ahrensia sp.]MCK5749558.1 TIGR01459 family HAD-type hydrolase [Oricola sp.]|tara:strand:- start:134446 stop:135294 length:849 start_codon:yes stop_codon:yes gene_type:complete